MSEAPPNTGFAAITWQQLRRRRLAMAGLWIIGLLVLMALLADFLASDLPIAARYQGRLYVFPNVTRPVSLLAEDNDTMRASLGSGDWLIVPPIPWGPEQVPPKGKVPPAPPDRFHWLGTDDTGRDVLARVIHGSRVSLSVGLVAVSLYLLIGVLVGAAAGFWGGRVDSLVSRLIEIMLSFPTLFLVLAISGMLQRPSIVSVMLVIGLTGWTSMARLVRAEILKLRKQDFVLAAEALGLRPVRIITRHLLPNTIGPVLVSATFGIASAVLIEAALSFLGLGTPPPTASWGELLCQAQENEMKWWLTLVPGLAIFVTVTAYNLVGEGLRDAIDPRLRDA